MSPWLPVTSCARVIPKEKALPGVLSLIGTCLDVAATVALAVSIVLLLILFADVLTPLPGMTGYPLGLVGALQILGLFSTPAICCTIVWPIHIRQKRQGAKVSGWLRFVVLASAAWTWSVYVGVSNL